MKIADFIRLHKSAMNFLSKRGIKMDDCKYVDMFADYEVMRTNGDKVTYIISELSAKYHISEASIYRILKRFKASI